MSTSMSEHEPTYDKNPGYEKHTETYMGFNTVSYRNTEQENLTPLETKRKVKHKDPYYMFLIHNEYMGEEL